MSDPRRLVLAALSGLAVGLVLAHWLPEHVVRVVVSCGTEGGIALARVLR